MGKPLSRPGCLRQSPCCSKKGEDGDAFNEDGYIPQRSIYDTMCINEHIDHGSAHSTLGSRGAQNAAFPSNGSLEPIQIDIFDKRSPQVSSFGRRLDERVIFDSLKLAHDEQTRSPGGYVRTVSPSVSCSSAPCGSGSVNKRYHHQDSGKKENLCRHSWKVVTPPKYPECIELSPGEKHLLNPGTAFFPGSLSSPRSPQISPFSGSPLSAGAHTPPVFFSPGKPLLFHQEQFHRQSLPAKFQPYPPTSPLSELSVSALQYDHRLSHGMESLTMERMDRCMLVSTTQSIEDEVFGEVEAKPMDSKGLMPYPPTPEPENDTAPLLQPPVTQPPARSPVMMESTWPRRLIGRRRTVRQGGAVHNLPILPPLPSVLRRCVTDKKTLPRLSPFPEHQAKVDVALLGKSPLKGELLKDCSLQDWKILKEIEERKGGTPASSQQEASPEVIQEEEVQEEELSQIPEQEEIVPKQLPTTEASNKDEENWEAVLEMVNNMWDDAWEEQETQLTGSLRQCWPLLQPPTGFGGSQAPSCSNSLVGVEDLLDMEMINKDELKDTKEARLQALLQHSLSTDSEQLKHIEKKAVRGIIHVVDKQPEQTATSISLDLITVEAQVLMAEEHVNGSLKMSTVNEESPDSNVTFESDSGVYLTNRSHTSQEDFTVDVDRTLTDIDMGSTSSLSQVEEIAGDRPCRKVEEKTERIYRNRVVIQSSVDGDLLSDSIRESSRSSLKNTQQRPQIKNIESWKSENKTTVIRVGTDSPLPLSPSKHVTRASTTLLDSGDMDPFVATDSFVYLAVSAKPQELSTTVKAIQKEALPSVTSTKPCLNPDECDFLSTDSFVYLAAPDCHLMGTEGHSMCSDSKDSDSDEDSGSRVDCAAGSTVGDSDWDSDLTDSEPEGSSSAKPGWDLWDELEQEVLPGLFDEDEEQELDKLYGGASHQQQQIGWQQAELAPEASVAEGEAEKVLAVSVSTEGEETHMEVKSVR